MQVSSDRRDQLASIVDHLDVSIRVRDWQSARRQGLCAAVLAEELDDVDLMARLGDDLERLNEFAVAGRLMARAGRRISQITGPEWNGNRVNGTLLIGQRIRHIGAAIRNACHVPVAAKYASRCVVIINPRLEALYRRSFPGVEVHRTGSSHVESVCRNAEAVAGFETLMQHLATSGGSVAENFSPLRPDPEAVDHFRGVYRQKASHLTIGVAWASTNGNKDLPSLSCWGEFIRSTEARFVSLQYGDISGDLRNLNSVGAAVHHDPLVDSLGDLDSFAAQIASLDGAITISNTAAHMAGALGVPTVVLLDDNFHLTWPVEGTCSPYFPSLALVRKQGRPWEDVMPQAQELLLTMAKR